NQRVSLGRNDLLIRTFPKTQWAEINRAIEYGKSQGVKVTVTQVK
ncbi:TPA: hypothetical protein ACH9S4_004782, partial [Escherichia coli]